MQVCTILGKILTILKKIFSFIIYLVKGFFWWLLFVISFGIGTMILVKILKFIYWWLFIDPLVYI